jgi:predicted transposase YdaD
MDHDRLFKQLLQTFFSEFLDLFLPDVLAYIEPQTIEFLDKEVFTDLTGGRRHEVDLLVKCRFREKYAYLLILGESQNKRQANFASRIFHYVARLMEKFQLPVYPIALLTFSSPKSVEPDVYEVEFPDLKMLTFRFRTIQLNRLNWRDFVDNPNPVAAALMTRMRFEPKDRPWVKLACLRMMVTLTLNKAKQALIAEFMDRYLQLNRAEFRVYDQAVRAMDKPEREKVMKAINEYKELGRAEGRAEGKAEFVLQMISDHFGKPSADLRERVGKLRPATLRALGTALFDFEELADVEAWLAKRR